MPKESVELRDNQFVYKDEVVTVTGIAKDDSMIFKYLDSTQGQIQKLAPDLYEELTNKAREHHNNLEAIREQRHKEELQRRLKENQEKHDKFVEYVKAAAPELEAHTVEYGRVSENRAGLSFRVGKFSIEYDSKVFGDFRAKRTKRVWVLLDNNYNRRRYKNFSLAVKRVLEGNEKENKLKNDRMTAEQKRREFAVAVGLNMTKGWHSTRHGGRGSGYTTYHLESATLDGEYDPMVKFDLTTKYNSETESRDYIATHVHINKPIELFGRKIEKTSLTVSLETPEEIRAFYNRIMESSE